MTLLSDLALGAGCLGLAPPFCLRCRMLCLRRCACQFLLAIDLPRGVGGNTLLKLFIKIRLQGVCKVVN